MKKLNLMIAVLLGLSFPAGSFASTTGDDQDSLGLPGDNLDLYGTLELFKKSATIEDFEKALNTESNNINNLDLDGDNKTDYIRVIDNSETEAHAIKLEVALSETESQDIAVIEIEKGTGETANLQIIGDEDLYGKDYIVEPSDSTSGEMHSSPEGRGPSFESFIPSRIILVNVWGWPCVRHVYGPKYIFWVSPWHWGFYPVWWHPWVPTPWHVYHKHYVHCRAYHRRVYVYNMNHAHKIYHAHRMASPTVYKKNHPGGHGGAVVKPGPYGNKPGPYGKNGPSCKNF